MFIHFLLQYNVICFHVIFLPFSFSGIRKDTLPDAKALAGFSGKNESSSAVYLHFIKKVSICNLVSRNFFSFSGLFVDKKRQPKKMPSCAALLGKAEEEEGMKKFLIKKIRKYVHTTYIVPNSPTPLLNFLDNTKAFLFCSFFLPKLF